MADVGEIVTNVDSPVNGTDNFVVATLTASHTIQDAVLNQSTNVPPTTNETSAEMDVFVSTWKLSN